jgi:hypothetical protein
MSGPYKFMAASAAGLLLGFGICGIDAKFFDRGNTEFGGGPLSGFGLVVCLISLAVFVAACLAALVSFIRENWRRR